MAFLRFGFTCPTERTDFSRDGGSILFRDYSTNSHVVREPAMLTPVRTAVHIHGDAYFVKAHLRLQGPFFTPTTLPLPIRPALQSAMSASMLCRALRTHS